jgi:hypothetical protein
MNENILEKLTYINNICINDILICNITVEDIGVFLNSRINVKKI